ncbi:PAS domain S-box protein [Peribacillus saganii]|uniref:HTH-type transcriptional regulatory protein TyrR n=1 Tax=Peribacillus saganii TaxID=2303992 RepID=A0A372LSN8_9BACI|nr:sigma 54-interacting transcriptional regulator [Peribacillus saganii]RFU70917.1 PAS domain S-box protein [Peribacillus saganii]
MKDYNLKMTIEAAITHFPQGSNAVKVYDETGGFAGYITMDALSAAVQQGELTRPISQFVIADLPIPNMLPNSISSSQFESFFQSEFCRLVFNSLYDGVYVTDGKGTTLFINKAYQRITGIKEEEVYGKHMGHLIEEGIISISASLEAILKKQPVTLIQKIRNERRIIVSSTPIMSAKGDVLYVLSSVRDITELIRLKHELDLQKLTFKHVADTSFLPEHSGFDNLVIGPSTRPLFKLADKVAKTDAKILLQGETGVGKSLIAKYIHSRSLRSNGTFMEINCGAIPEHLVEAELFGYEPGSFTGALKQGKKGIFEEANGGTLFLDEIADLPLHLQVKLLKAVEENRFMRVGGTETVQVDVRIITATHRNLKNLVNEGRFREDLYYRLNIVTFEVPPLRDRREEIMPLLEMYLNRYNTKYEEDKKITPECYEWLTNYGWPGNIRELANLVERLVVITFNTDIDVSDLPPFLQPAILKTETGTLKEETAKLERSLILEAIHQYGSTRSAAKSLGISQSAIVQKMKKYHIRVENESK